MKKYHWLLVFLSALSLFLAACDVSEFTTPRLNLPSGGLKTSDGHLMLTGTGPSGYEVLAIIDGRLVGASQIGDDNTWSLEISLTEPGEQQLTLQTVSANGIVVGRAQTVMVIWTSAGVEAPPPTMNLPAGGAELEAGELVLTGTGVPGSDVQLVVDGQVAGTTEVGDDGTWSLEISLTEPGDHELTVQNLDASGAVVAEAEAVTLSLAGPAEPEEVPAPAAAAAVAPDLLFPADGADVLTGQLTLIGSGAPGSEVEILDGSVVLGTAEVGTDGEWRYTFEPKAGAYQIAVRSVADTRTPDSFIAVRVSSDKDGIDCYSNPGIDRGEVFIVGTCDTLEDISKLLEINLEDLEAANPQLEDPDLVYPGQFVTLPE